MEKDWELVRANEVNVVDALKKEGNQLFQQQRYLDAIQVYARAIEKLPDLSLPESKFTVEDKEAFTTLEVAVRLNRALAYIEVQDVQLLPYAEEDCTVALRKQPTCVKGWYRRALAREKLNNFKEALSDAQRMHELEPSNPAAHGLIIRLQEASSSLESARQHSELSQAMNRCTMDKNIRRRTSRKQVVHGSADDLWKSLQDEEKQLRQVFKSSTAASRACKPTRKRKENNTVVRQAERAISDKTESVWDSLRAEEESTVSKVYKRTGRQENVGKNSASIHPNP